MKTRKNSIPKRIIINKEWLDGLVEIVDRLEKSLDIDDRYVMAKCLAGYLSGYIHALDNQVKEE